MRVIPRADHGISRTLISEGALKTLYRLNKGGYDAYLVGGGVRDLLLGREPKDFDVATSATPEQVRALFRNCRIIGRRFRLAHVQFGNEIIEVATFRAHHEVEEGEASDGKLSDDGMILRDNVWGTVEQDAWRRDFTVNALYYNIRDFSVVDYTGGVEDLKAGTLRIIGDPEQRFREDPVRMLRAVRFAAKLGFRIDERSEDVIYEVGHLLRAVPAARLFDECLKMFHAGYAVETFELLRHYHLFEHLFPDTDEVLAQPHEEEGFPLTFVARALGNTDQRISENKAVTPAFLFAALLWEPARLRAEELKESGVAPLQAMQEAGDEVVARQVKFVAFPKRFSLQSREIWEMQERLTRRNGKAPARLMEHPRFRAAYDFLVLRAECGEEVGELADWWTRFQAADEGGRAELLARPAGDAPRRKRRRRGGARRRRAPAENPG